MQNTVSNRTVASQGQGATQNGQPNQKELGSVLSLADLSKYIDYEIMRQYNIRKQG